jgi:xylulokinase
VGEVTPEAAGDLGLKRGIPVVAGGNDSACSMLGAGVIEAGMVLESIGTSIIFAYVNDRPVFDARLMNRCHVVPARWFNLAGMSTPGAAYRWFREELGQQEKQLAAERDTDPYTLLDEAADASPPGARGLTFLPYLSGERSPIWDPKARGVIFGLTLSHTRKDLIRSILEGGAYAVFDNMEVFTKRGVDIKEIRITGGGAKSRVWRQIMADVLGVPLQISSTVETATLGAAILAGCGAEIFKTPQEAVNRLVKVVEGEKPRANQHTSYVKRFQLFKKIYESLRDCFDLASALETPT